VVFLVLSIYYSTDIWASLAFFIVGVIFFTFLEYAVHAWLFHEDHPLKVFIEGHAHHHQNPFSYDAMPLVYECIDATVFAWLLHFIMPYREERNWATGLGLGIGFLGLF